MNANKLIIALAVLLVVLLSGALAYRYVIKPSPVEPLGPDPQDTSAVMPSGTGKVAPSQSVPVTPQEVDAEDCFLVVSKTDYKLYVYQAQDKDTVCVASFPVCYAKNKGQKTRDGDYCTPECSYEHPFTISEIKDASTWCHDFHDGRGEILAYGHWFMRLDLSEAFPDNEAVAKNRSIGIHGSTNNESSVPGNGSEGCIRLRDEDLEILHDKYAYVGQKVIVLPYKNKK